MKGKFIVLDGCDFAGKSTQMYNISSFLAQNNIKHILTREPGGTPFGEELRTVAFKYGKNVNKMAELLLFLSARVEHYFSKIQPALQEGTWVVCDRFAPSTFVYQGILQNINWQTIKNIHEQFLPNIMPNLTLILSIPPQKTLERLKAISQRESENVALKKNFLFAKNGGIFTEDLPMPSRERLNSYDETTLQKIIMVYNGFLKFSEEFNCTIIDANESQDDVFAQMKPYIATLFK